MCSDGKNTECKALPSGVSVVTTAYNEVEYVRRFVEEVHRSLKNIPHEIIIVDDSSPDSTYEVARKVADLAIKKSGRESD